MEVKGHQVYCAWPAAAVFMLKFHQNFPHWLCKLVLVQRKCGLLIFVAEDLSKTYLVWF